METSGVIRSILIGDIVALALLALIYLRQRRMNWSSFCCWGLLAVFVPVLGPFMVIASRPGEWDPAFSPLNDLRRAVSWLRRLLPEPPPPKKIARLDKARMRRQQALFEQQAHTHEKPADRKKKK